LIRAADDNLYGTAFAGGVNHLGSVFKITPSGLFTTVYSFGTMAGDGINPSGALVRGRDGHLYGTTSRGGSVGTGTVFRY
jgi:uncharacterized repeat protein (TIGR03803 family)